jgi:glycosyl transferase family 25
MTSGLNVKLPVYVINLDRRRDRLERMLRIFSSAGVEFQTIPAVDAQDLKNASSISVLKQSGPIGGMGLGTLACSLSHYNAWKKFLDDPARPERGLFLEDDVNISPNFLTISEDLLYNDYGYDLIKVEASRSIAKGAVLGPRHRISSGICLRECFSLALGGAGYILSRKGAQLATDRFTAIDVAIDHFLFYPARRNGVLNLKFMITEPSLVAQERALGSDISKHRMTGSRLSRDLVRGFYEAATLGPMITGLVFHRGRLVKVAWPDWA